MNKLVIPSSPNWYETDILACAPDNTVIFGSRSDIIVIKPTAENEPDDIQIITRAHSMRIKSININRNWGQPHKYAVTVAEDKLVKLWDIETLEKKSSHNKHVSQDDDTKVVGASFAGDDRVVSATESGTVVIWNVNLNETNTLNALFDTKVTVTCLSVCPHASWLAGLGLKSGLIIVADLRRTGKILYKLRGHDKSVVSLSWCPVPVNIFPIRPNNKVVEKSLEDTKPNTEEKVEDASVAPANGTDKKEESLELTKDKRVDGRKQKNPKKIQPNPWVGLVHADDEPTKTSEKSIERKDSEKDFLQECMELKTQILHMSTPKTEALAEKPASEPLDSSRPILKPRKKNKKFNLSELVFKKDQKDDSPKIESEGDEAVDTPTDRRVMSMEISTPVETVALNSKLTDNKERSMELTSCGESIFIDTAATKGSTSSTVAKNNEESVCTVDKDTTLSVCETKGSTSSTVAENEQESISAVDAVVTIDDTSKLQTTTSSEESKKFSSVSSCDGDQSCLKKNNQGDVKKSDTSSASESGEVFHDAQVLPDKTNDGGERYIVEPSVGVDEQPRKEFLLASSAKEPNIYIWRAGTDGRMQTFMNVPTAKRHKKSSRSDKIWITICWAAPHVLLSSSRSAELLQWTLPRPMLQSKFVRTVHKDHWSVLFSIKTPIVYQNEYNFLQKRDINAWTTGMERTLLNTDVGSVKNLACYPAFGGSVNCLVGSPLDPNRLAIGTGEGVINVWNLSREHKKRIIFSTYYQKIMSAVLTLAWHPTVETTLAWGTVEGRVGTLDTVSKSKPPKILRDHFKSQIYKVEWGPLNGDKTNLGLYVVSESRIAIFDLKAHEKEPQILELPDNTYVHTMSWKPDLSSLLVSSKSGSLITYTADLKISNISYLRQKLQSILWNPNAAGDDAAQSKYSNAFVSIIKSTEFQVYDLATPSDNIDDKVVAHFAENRNSIIKSIEWNPHCASQLVCADESGVAQVYDIEQKAVLATYVSPGVEALASVYWSPLDHDYVVVGTVSQKAFVWRVSENRALSEKEIVLHRSKVLKAQHKDAPSKEKVVAEEVKEPSSEVKRSSSSGSTKSPILPMFYGNNAKTRVADMKKLLRHKLGDDKDTNATAGGDNNQIDVLDVFGGGSEGMERVLGLNVATLKQSGKYKGSNMLSLFRGDLDASIREAVEQKRVDPWIIAMCPMVSPTLWKSACETYANQLLDEPDADPMDIVTYLLACHRVEEAVNVLCEKALFREAFVLAKARFGSDNSVVSEILDKWAKSMVYQGNFEFAAQCYISMGKYEEAASVLFRRSNLELLELAVELAKLSGNEELHKAVLFRFDAFNTAKSSKDEEKEDSKKIDRISDKSEPVSEEVVEKVKDESLADDVCKANKSDEPTSDKLEKNDDLKDPNNEKETVIKSLEEKNDDDTNKIELKDATEDPNEVDDAKTTKELDEPTEQLIETQLELAKLSGNEELLKAVLFRFDAFNTAKSSKDEEKEDSKKIDRISDKSELVSEEVVEKAKDESLGDDVCKANKSDEPTSDQLKKDDDLKDLNDEKETVIKSLEEKNNVDTNKIEVKDATEDPNEVDDAKTTKELDEPTKQLIESKHVNGVEKSEPLKEQAESLNEDAEKVLELQEGLLSSDEVRELLSKKKGSFKESDKEE